MSFPISISFDVKAPPVAAFDSLAQSAQKLDQAMQASAGNFDKFGQTVSQLESPLSSVGGSMGQLEGSMSGLEGSLGSAAGSMGEFAGSTEQLNSAIGETGGFVTDASTSMSDLSGTTSETGGAMGELSGTTGEFNGVIGETGGFVTETGTAMGELSTSTGETGTAMGELNTTTGETNTTFGELNPLVTETQTGFAEMVPVVTETGTGMTELTTATDETNTALETSVDALGNVVPGLADTATGAADSAQGFSDLRPAVDDTNSALDSSSGLLEGVSPLLADTGTNAGTAATETGEFSGALGGLGQELGPVNGGLTTENTLLGEVGGTSQTTAGQTEGLKGSMSGLAFGITGVVGSAFSLVGAFSNVRNAQFKVDAANRIVEISTKKLDQAIATMNATIRKLATDSEAPIGGLQRLAAAQKAFNDLVASGVKSGPAFKAALDELRAAQDALTTSTAKDAEQAAKLGFQLTNVSTASQKVAIDMNKQTRMHEGLAQTFGQLTSIATTAVGALGSFAQLMTSGAATAGILKGAFIDLGIVLSQSVLPALGAIAVPVGIAVAAIGAFIGVVTAIRANLRVFDELGVKVGEVFPEMKGFLDDARQAFINLSDGINSAISVALGAIDQMTGGVANLQAQWEGFTDTLPQGTGEMGIAGEAVRGLGLAFVDSSQKVKIGNGAWKDMGGTLVAFSGNVTVAAGSWRKLDDQTVEYVTTANQGKAGFEALTGAVTENAAAVETAGAAVKKQSANYSELTNAQKFNVAATNAMIEGITKTHEEMAFATAVAVSYLERIAGVNTELFASNAIITGVSDALQNQTAEHFEAVRAATAYVVGLKGVNAVANLSETQVLALAASLKEEQKAMGKSTEETAKFQQELDKLGQAHTDAAAEIAFYADATNMANRMQMEYQAGIDNANLKLIDQQAALANTAGELQRNFELLDEGTLQEIAFAQGVQEAAKALQDKILALEKMRGAYEATNALIKEGTLIAVEFATGMQETQTAVQKSALEVVNLAGELEGYNVAATKSQQANIEMVRGFLEQKKALNDLLFEYANAAGAVEALRMELTNSDAAVLRFNKGMMEGRKSALELMLGMGEARGEAIGFRSELLSAATAITKGMGDMSRKSTEALQQIIEVASGVPGAFEKVVQGIDAMGQKIIDTLTDAAQESHEKFNDEIEAMEKDLGTKFSEPIVQELHLQAQVEDATRDIETAMGVFAAMLRDKPLEVALETQGAQDALKLLQAEVDKAAALSPKFQPLQTALNNLAAWTPSAGLDKLPLLLTDVLQGAQAMEGGMQGAITAFDSMFSAAAQSSEGLAALKTAFESVGLSFDTTTGKITDASGKILADLQVMGEGATTSAATTVAAMDTLGPAGTAARTTLAFELVALEFLMDRMAQEVKQSAIEVSTAFSNMATNTGTSMNTLASGIIIMLAAFAKIGTGSQSMATTVSGSFSNMASNTRASMNTMASGILIIIASFTKMGTDAQRGTTTVSTAFTSMGSRVTSAVNTARSSITTLTSAVTTMASTGSSRASSFASSFSSAMSRVSSSASSAASSVRSLQSAINSLQSKTVTITTIYRRVVQTVYAAKGGAFVASSPMDLGGVKVSEFGQKELVTVTPLENPSGQTITGPGMQVSTSGPGAKAFAKSGTESISLGGPMNGGGNTPTNEEVKTLLKKISDSIETQTRKVSATSKGKTIIIKETPIIFKLNERTLIDAVNRRIFELSDSIIS